MRARQALWAGAAALALQGCTHLTAAERGPRTDPVARLAPTSPSPWREDFRDPTLRALLDAADAGSLDGKLALARLEKADAEVETADAVRGVNVVAGLSAAIGGANFHSSRSAATPTLEIRNELDVWGRLAHGRAAARAERTAVASDLAGARLQVGAETARSYLALSAAEATAEIARRRQTQAQAALDLMSQRRTEGSAGEHELAARRSALVACANAVARAEAEADLERARLSDLTGRTVSDGAFDFASVALTRPPAPVPSDVVDRRPAVQAAKARLTGADEHRAAAIAASRPQFQIAAAFGSPDAAIATLLDVRALAWAMAASVSHEILDGGARRARVHEATADADIADLGYRQAVLAGWQDLRARVAHEAEARRSVMAAQAELDAARAALAAGQVRHAAGAADGLAMASLQDAVAQAELIVCEARLQVALARVDLALATGST